MEIDPTLLKIMLNSFSYVLCVLGPMFLKNLHLGLSTEVTSSRFGSVVFVFSRHKTVVINDSFTLFEHERMRFTPVSFYLVVVQGLTCKKVFALSYNNLHLNVNLHVIFDKYFHRLRESHRRNILGRKTASYTSKCYRFNMYLEWRVGKQRPG